LENSKDPAYIMKFLPYLFLLVIAGVAITLVNEARRKVEETRVEMGVLVEQLKEQKLQLEEQRRGFERLRDESTLLQSNIREAQITAINVSENISSELGKAQESTGIILRQANESLQVTLQDIKTAFKETDVVKKWIDSNYTAIITNHTAIKVRLKPIEDQIQVHFVDRPRTSCSQLSLEGVTADGFYEINHVAFEEFTELLQCNLSHPLGSYLNPAESCQQLEAVGTNLSFPNVYFMRPKEFNLDPRVDVPALTPCSPLMENGTELVMGYDMYKPCYALQQMNYTKIGEYWLESGVKVFCNLTGVVSVAKAFAVGGLGAVAGATDARLNTAERYDPATKQWEDVISMKSSRQSAGLVVLTDPTDNKQYNYAVGGFGAVASATEARLNTVERYDPTTNQWEDVISMKSRRGGVGLVVLTDPTDNNKQYIYAVGGFGAVGSATDAHLNTVERYDPATKQWEDVTSMKSRRSSVGIVVLTPT
jgi:hypothetical protein